MFNTRMMVFIVAALLVATAVFAVGGTAMNQSSEGKDSLVNFFSALDDAARSANYNDGGGSAGGPGGSSVDGAVGGGPEYVQETGQEFCDIPSSAASTKSELENALSSASSGDTVYVDGNAEIDTGFDASITVPSGVTLASNRGCNNADGGLLYTDDKASEKYAGDKILQPESNARITGLRIRGAFDTTWFDNRDDDSIYYDSKGINVQGSDVEIDNNQIWGFARSGVEGGPNTHVHHNYIHTMPREGLGYGVAMGDNILIEYNHFNYNRHSVASGGRKSYTARYNYVGPDAIAHVFDMHQDGGGTIKIHHNTVEAVEDQNGGGEVPAVTIRGTPSDKAEIHNNWFYNTNDPCTRPGDSWPDCAILQNKHGNDRFVNVNHHDNHYGSDEPSCDYGAPRKSC